MFWHRSGYIVLFHIIFLINSKLVRYLITLQHFFIFHNLPWALFAFDSEALFYPRISNSENRMEVRHRINKHHTAEYVSFNFICLFIFIPDSTVSSYLSCCFAFVTHTLSFCFEIEFLIWHMPYQPYASRDLQHFHNF